MSLSISDRIINKIQVIDDDPNVRLSYEYPIEELNLTSIKEEGPLPNLSKFIQQSIRVADAAICDFQLRVRNYARFNGAETVSLMYQNKFPAILCTRYDKSSIDEIRKYIRYIPVLINPDELTPSSIKNGIELCINEFIEKFVPSRKPWRTLVRIDDLDEENGFFYIIIPAWNSNQIIRIMKSDIPQEIREELKIKSRLHAQVNLGAESSKDIYFDEWEPG